jgi:hypothetical protein
VRKSSLVLAAFLVAGAAASARADQKLFDTKVPFTFTAGSTQLPAGQYELLSVDPGASNDVIVKNVDTGKSVIVESVTRLAAKDEGQSDLVFDDLGGRHILSEVRPVGIEGYLLPAAGPSAHIHTTVKGS